MKNISVIKKNKEFKKVYKYGKSYADKNLVFFLLKNKENQLKVGITTAKRINKAVVRNKIRRRLKEIVRKNKNNIKDGYYLVIMCRIRGKNSSYKELEHSFIKLAKRTNIYVGDKN